jgi:hypothetical protein
LAATPSATAAEGGAGGDSGDALEVTDAGLGVLVCAGCLDAVVDAGGNCVHAANNNKESEKIKTRLISAPSKYIGNAGLKTNPSCHSSLPHSTEHHPAEHHTTQQKTRTSR